METPFPLGRKIEHDPRSLAYPAPAADTVASVSWTHYGAVLDQGDLGSCTGNALTQALNTKPLHKPRTPCYDENTAVELYKRATVLDDFDGTYPPDDSGSSGLGACKAGVEAGYITRYLHAFGIDHALGALQSGPIMLGTNWYKSMFSPNPSGFVSVSGEVAGGHEYLCIGVNARSKYVTCLNSWSSAWGRNGKFKMSFDTLDRLLHEHGDVIQPQM